MIKFFYRYWKERPVRRAFNENGLFPYVFLKSTQNFNFFKKKANIAYLAKSKIVLS